MMPRSGTRRVVLLTRVRPTLGAVRRTLHRLAARIPAGAGHDVDWDRSSAVPASLDRLLLIGGRLLLAVGHPRRAQAVLERLLASPAVAVEAHIALGQSLMVAGADGLINRPPLGIDVAPCSNPVLAIEAFDRALEVDPGNVRARLGLARARCANGDRDAAAQITATLDSTGSASSADIGEVIDLIGRSRGAHLRSEATAVVDHWSAALAANPTDHATRHRLVNLLVQLGRFEEAQRVSWPGGPAPAGDATTFGADAGLAHMDPPIEWMYAMYARLLAAGDVAGATRLKRQAAERRQSATVSWHSPTTQLVSKIQAMSYARGPAEALSAVRNHRLILPTQIERRIAKKLESDLELALGNPKPTMAFRQQVAPATATEQTFRTLVSGSHIVVVGPANTGRPTDAELDAADVIVTTKRSIHPSLAGKEIVYQSDALARLDTVAPPANPAMTVLRPSMLSHGALGWPGFGPIRFMPSEDSNTFLGTRFGVPRILYDLVHYEPASITLTGVDFFLADQPYIPGYDRESDQIYSLRELQPVMSTAAHDYAWDYAFVRTLAHAGLVAGTPDVAALMHHDDDEYLRLLMAHLRAASRSDCPPSPPS